MIGLTIKVEAGAVMATITSLSEPLRREAIESIGMLLIGQAKQNIDNRAGPGGPWPVSFFDKLYAGPRIWSDIRRSITYVVDAAAGTLAIGASHIAAPVRQLGTIGAGGTMPDIVPVKKKWLAIPISDAASKASYQGIPAREAFPEGFLLKEEHGASPLRLGVVARLVGGRTNKKTGKKENQRLEELYILTKRARIRPHPFLPIDRDGKLQDGLWPQIEELVINNFAKAG